jgi:hypothetical protein
MMEKLLGPEQDKLGIVINAVLVLYLTLIAWRIFSNFQKLWRQSSFLLDTLCHLVLLLFLYLTFNLMTDDLMNLKINLSTALCVLCSCLISLIFGITIGRSWGYAEAKNEKHDIPISNAIEKKRIIKSKNNIPASSSSSSLTSSLSTELMDSYMSTQSSSTVSGSQTSSHNVTAMDTQEIYEAAEVAKLNLLSILEIHPTPRSENFKTPSGNWKLARSGLHSHVWISTQKTTKTVIKGSCITSLSPAAVAKYFFQNNLSTGLEGIMKEKEMITSFRRNRVVLARMLCNLGKLTSAKREFYLVTYWAEMENGTIVICSRSLPEAYLPPHSTSASASSSSSSSKHKSYTRGFISSCGFVIIPNRLLSDSSASAEMRNKRAGCQVLYCVDIDFCSSSMGMKRQHSAKSEAIVNSTVELLDQLSGMAPEHRNNSNSNSIDSLTLSPGTLLDHAMGGLETPSEKHFQGVIQGISHQHRLELMNISKDSINRLLSLHMTAAAVAVSAGNAVSVSVPKSLSSASSRGDRVFEEKKWTSFYDQDEIVISEYCGNDSPMGTLMASCHVNVRPSSSPLLLCTQLSFPLFLSHSAHDL